jgi:hypothetical protein
VTIAGRTHSLGYHRTPELAAARVAEFRRGLSTAPDSSPPDADGAVTIPLRRRDGSVRAYALIDQEDAHLAEHRWCLNGKGYVIRRAPAGDGTYQSVSLHRSILGLGARDPREVDHISRDKLDNRRANLRIVSHASQVENVPARGGSSSHRGVTWNKQRRMWAARASVRGKRHHLGYFDDEQEAARAALTFRQQHMPHAVD